MFQQVTPDPSEIESKVPRVPLGEDNAQPRKYNISILDEVHRHLLVRAFTRVTSTEIAEETYAQLIDGLPIADVAGDKGYRDLPYGHPIFEVHEELCPGVIEKTQKFYDEFQFETLHFDAKLLFEFQAASPGSRAFNVRLIELVAVALHQIAVVIYQLDENLHKNDSVNDWKPPESDKVFWNNHPDGPLPILFQHAWYLAYDQYPDGVADMAGYWAESRILGGVVLFDRRDPAKYPEADPNAIYLHPDRYDASYRIVQLLPEQRKALLDFLTGEDEPTTPLLPIIVDRSNIYRVDPEEPMRETGIYRDLWERKDFPPEAGDSRLRDVVDRHNFPTKADWVAAHGRARARRAKYYRDEL
ncbi:hypothetical protein PGQ11_009810 [Apiospora arundinis]|uniref:Uncharacterized protein n=1 Tax=Apiospora arundinis TaxID=335852 RepID=A0ABR2I8A6_9PEZI